MEKDSPVKKILILAANPTNTARLRLSEEVREIDKGLRLSENRAQFDIKQEWAVQLDDLRRALLRHKPHIVHFCGHGKEDKAREPLFGDPCHAERATRIRGRPGFFE